MSYARGDEYQTTYKNQAIYYSLEQKDYWFYALGKQYSAVSIAAAKAKIDELFSNSGVVSKDIDVIGPNVGEAYSVSDESFIKTENFSSGVGPDYDYEPVIAPVKTIYTAPKPTPVYPAVKGVVYLAAKDKSILDGISNLFKRVGDLVYNIVLKANEYDPKDFVASAINELKLGLTGTDADYELLKSKALALEDLAAVAALRRAIGEVSFNMGAFTKWDNAKQDYVLDYNAAITANTALNDLIRRLQLIDTKSVYNVPTGGTTVNQPINNQISVWYYHKADGSVGRPRADGWLKSRYGNYFIRKKM